MEVRGFSEASFTFENKTVPIYRRGEGPGVVVMHEIPGITPQVARFGRRVADAGFTVVMPSLFGMPGKPLSVGYLLGSTARVCVNREFSVLAARGSSPVTHFLRALCRQVHQDCGGVGVGAVGMCLTGNFALSLMVDPSVMAPVLSQPSLPFGLTRRQRAAIHVSDEELAVIKQRTAEGTPVLGLRFTHDVACRAARFNTLREELGAGFEAIEIDSGPGNAHGIKRIAHSVLTNDLVDEVGHPTRAALDRVLGFFQQRLKPPTTLS
ncbi:MAG: dienelactone hydrolase family protein [Pseudomonadota bacterium]|nr:dienelactone hydrolase family protein [Pseudomonadota bacterium]